MTQPFNVAEVFTGQPGKYVSVRDTVQGFKEKGRQAVIKVDNNTNITINRTAIAGLAGKVKDEELEQA